MSDGLGIINDQLSYEDNLKIIGDALKEHTKKLLNLTASILKDKRSKSVQSVTDTSYIKLTEFQFLIQSSGGITVIWFSPYIGYNNITVSFQIRIDDETEREASYVSAASEGMTVFIPLVKKLTKGNHTVKVYVKVSSGTGTVGDTVYDSTMYIVELNGGD